MMQTHPNARTTPAIRAEIARSSDPSGVLAQRYNVSTETVRKWRKRGLADCFDRPATPHTLPWKANNEERAVVCVLRRVTNFALDDLTLVATQFLPHLNRDSIWRILRTEGLNRRTPPPADRPQRDQGRFQDRDLNFVHIEIERLPKLQTASGDRRKRFLYVAVDRRSRSVHLDIMDDKNESSAIVFLKNAADAFPFRFTHVLTDNGSCFTPQFAEACTALGVEHRIRKCCNPQTDGFDGRVGSAVLGATNCSQQKLKQPLSNFSDALNASHQHVLEGGTPAQVATQHLKSRRELARGQPGGRTEPADTAPTGEIVYATNNVSQLREPKAVNARFLPDGSSVDIFGGFTRKSLEIYPATCLALKKYNDGSPRFWSFVHDILDGADNARAWRKAEAAGRPDPNQARRQEDVNFLREARAAVAAGRKFATFMQQSLERMWQPVTRAILAVKEEDGKIPLITSSSDSEKVNPFVFDQGSHTEVLHRLICYTLQSIEREPPAKAGPWLHRSQFGPLLFHRPIDIRSRLPDPQIDRLLFGTVLLARQFTSKTPFGVQKGMIMPTRAARAASDTNRDPGKPLWPLAAAVLSDALGEHLTEGAARNRLEFLIQRNPGLGWLGWPTPPSDLFDRYF